MVKVRPNAHPPPTYSPSASSNSDSPHFSIPDVSLPEGLSFLDSPARPQPHSAINSALKTIPPTPHTAPFSCPLLTPLLSTGALTREHFSHLACSFFPSHDSGVPAPTLLELKKHAQALCLLISTLECSDLEREDGSGLPPAGSGPGSGAWDFLDDVYMPYENECAGHSQPLRSVVNSIPAARAVGRDQDGSGCRVLDAAEEMGDVTALVKHVNECLEEIDHALSPHGGLLALLPLDTEMGAGEGGSERSLFGQWLHYTQNLVRRVVELERDVARLRELVATSAQMVVPGVSATDPNAGDELGERASRVVTEQDRYVLAGLNDRLWDKLNAELDTSERMSRARNQSLEALGVARKTGNGGRKGGGDQMGVHGRTGMGREGLKDVVAWVEVTSRVFRVTGQDRVFLIPAWDIKPGADAVRKIEETPQIRTVYMRVPAEEGGGTAKQRSIRRKFEMVEGFEKEIEKLREKLAYEQDSRQKWVQEMDKERKKKNEEIEKWRAMAEERQLMLELGEDGNATERGGKRGGAGKGKADEKGKEKESGRGNGKEVDAGMDEGKGRKKEASAGEDGGEREGDDGDDDGGDDRDKGRKGNKKTAKKGNKKKTDAEKKEEEEAKLKAEADAFREGRKDRKAAFMAECHRKCREEFAATEKAVWMEEYKSRGEKEYNKKQRGGVKLARGEWKVSDKERTNKRAEITAMWMLQGQRVWEKNEASRERDSDETDEDELPPHERHENDDSDNRDDDGDGEEEDEAEALKGRSQSI